MTKFGLGFLRIILNTDNMIVKVNNQEVRIFKGASVKHALLRYILRVKADVSNIEKLQVKDRKGHQLDQDAPLKEGDSITVNL